MFIAKPAPRNGKYVVAIRESKSPLAATIEELWFETSGAAWEGYRAAKKQNGDWY